MSPSSWTSLCFTHILSLRLVFGTFNCWNDLSGSILVLVSYRLFWKSFYMTPLCFTPSSGRGGSSSRSHSRSRGRSSSRSSSRSSKSSQSRSRSRSRSHSRSRSYSRSRSTHTHTNTQSFISVLFWATLVSQSLKGPVYQNQQPPTVRVQTETSLTPPSLPNNRITMVSRCQRTDQSSNKFSNIDTTKGLACLFWPKLSNNKLHL